MGDDDFNGEYIAEDAAWLPNDMIKAGANPWNVHAFELANQYDHMNPLYTDCSSITFCRVIRDAW